MGCTACQPTPSWPLFRARLAASRIGPQQIRADSWYCCCCMTEPLNRGSSNQGLTHPVGASDCNLILTAIKATLHPSRHNCASRAVNCYNHNPTGPKPRNRHTERHEWHRHVASGKVSGSASSDSGTHSDVMNANEWAYIVINCGSQRSTNTTE